MNKDVAHVWDMGLLHRWWHADPENVGERFARYAASQSEGYTVAAVDCDWPSWRFNLFPEYKSTRVANPDRTVIDYEIKIAVEVFRSLKVKPIQVDLFEADDIIATVTRRALAAGWRKVIIHSADKDMIQLLQEDRVVLHNGKEWVGIHEVITKFGVIPAKFVDYLAIVGDSSDSIPGAKGLGPVAARSILRDHGSLERALKIARLQSVLPDPKQRDKLLAKLFQSEKDVLLAWKLIKLDDNVPIGTRKEEEG